MKVYALIPARGGSKGLPRKNIRLLDGRPLLDYTIRAARQARNVQAVFVSTEDGEIADVARRGGAEVLPRPAALASDTATSNEVLRDACRQWEREGRPPQVVVYLQATDLFRPRGIIDRCVERLMADESLDAVFAAARDHKNYWIEEKGLWSTVSRGPDQPRQVKPPWYREDTGIACATRFPVARDMGRLGRCNAGIVNDAPFSFLDIHTEDDLWLAEQLVRRFKGTGLYEF